MDAKEKKDRADQTANFCNQYPKLNKAVKACCAGAGGPEGGTQ